MHFIFNFNFSHVSRVNSNGSSSHWQRIFPRRRWLDSHRGDAIRGKCSGNIIGKGIWHKQCSSFIKRGTYEIALPEQHIFLTDATCLLWSRCLLQNAYQGYALSDKTFWESPLMKLFHCLYHVPLPVILLLHLPRMAFPLWESGYPWQERTCGRCLPSYILVFSQQRRAASWKNLLTFIFLNTFLLRNNHYFFCLNWIIYFLLILVLVRLKALIDVMFREIFVTLTENQARYCSHDCEKRKSRE